VKNKTETLEVKALRATPSPQGFQLYKEWFTAKLWTVFLKPLTLRACKGFRKTVQTDFIESMKNMYQKLHFFCFVKIS